MRCLSALVLLSLGAAARAQLVFGTTSTVLTGAYYLDLSTSVARQLWSGSASGRKVDGLTADAANGVLYNADSARLSRWAYGSVGTPPTFLTGFYRPTTSATTPTTASGVSALAYARGSLYAYTNFASTIASAGIFRVDLGVVGSASVANMIPVWTQANNTQYNFQGLDYDPVTGFMYATNTPVSGAPTTPAGLYRIDLFAATPTVTKMVDFDPSLPAPDGLTIGGGKVWMSAKPANSSILTIGSFDLTTMTYDPTVLTLDTGDTTGRATDLAWAPGANPVPEPAALLPLALGLGYAVRRRRPATLG